MRPEGQLKAANTTGPLNIHEMNETKTPDREASARNGCSWVEISRIILPHYPLNFCLSPAEETNKKWKVAQIAGDLFPESNAIICRGEHFRFPGQEEEREE